MTRIPFRLLTHVVTCSLSKQVDQTLLLVALCACHMYGIYTHQLSNTQKYQCLHWRVAKQLSELPSSIVLYKTSSQLDIKVPTQNGDCCSP